MKNIKLLTSTLAFATIVSMGLTGCTEDDSSGGSSDVQFPTNSKQAEPTLENGKELKNVITSRGIMSLPLLDSVGGKKTNSINRIQPRFSTDVGTETCVNGGNVKTNISGKLTSSTVKVTMKHDQCNDGQDLTNGSISYSASASNYLAQNQSSIHVSLESDFSIKDLSSGKTVEIIKGSDFTISSVDTKTKLTINLNANDGKHFYGQKNAIYYIYSDNNSYTKMYQTSGKVYFSKLNKYVEYDTSYDMSKTPFTYNSGVLLSGESRYNMSNGGKVKFIVVSQGNVVTHIDADGDGVYELQE